MNKGIIIFIIFLGLGLFIVQGGSAVFEQAHPLEGIMDEAGAQITSAQANYWGITEEAYLDFPAIEEKIAHIIENIGLQDVVESERTQGENYRSLGKEGTLSTGVKAKIIIQSVPEALELEQRPATYLLVNVDEEWSGKGYLTTISRRLENTLKDYTDRGHLTLDLFGQLPDRIERHEMEKLVDSLLQSMNASLLEKYTDKEVVNVSAYTPRVSKFIRTENGKINLNIAMRNDANLGKTVIRAGYPMINSTY